LNYYALQEPGIANYFIMHDEIKYLSIKIDGLFEQDLDIQNNKKIRAENQE
jgi:hypothetical protein